MQIHELNPFRGQLEDEDVLAIDDGDETQKITFAQIKAAMPESTPIGSIQIYAGATAPEGWILCDGSPISRSNYSELYAVIGTTYGSGDGSSTFNVPDLRDRFPIGAGSSYSRNSKGGSKDATLISHNHDVSSISISSSGGHSHNGTRRPINTTGGSSTMFVGANASEADTTSALVTRSDTPGAHTHTVPSHSTQNRGSGDGTNANLPPYIGLNFIIYAGQ